MWKGLQAGNLWIEFFYTWYFRTYWRRPAWRHVNRRIT